MMTVNMDLINAILIEESLTNCIKYADFDLNNMIKAWQELFNKNTSLILYCVKNHVLAQLTHRDFIVINMLKRGFGRYILTNKSSLVDVFSKLDGNYSDHIVKKSMDKLYKMHDSHIQQQLRNILGIWSMYGY